MTTERQGTLSNVGHHQPSVVGYELLEKRSYNPDQTVWLARQITTDILADISFFTPPINTDATRWTKSIAQFRILLEAQQKLTANANIQRILDYGEIDNIFYVATEHVEGRTLREILDTDGVRSIEWFLPFFTQVAFALDFAAAQKLSHGGLTPRDIVIREADQSAYIIDFGLARARKRLGSPYLAPEQLAGQGGDTRSDMYSLGAILYEGVSGRPPFVDADTDNNVEAICRKIQTSEPAPLLNQPIYLREVIARMMMKSPSQRYRVFVDVVQDLQYQRRPAPLSGSQTPGSKEVGWVLGPETPYFDALAGEILPPEEKPGVPIGDRSGWLVRKTSALTRFLLAPFYALAALGGRGKSQAPSDYKVIRFRNEYLVVRWLRRGVQGLWRVGRVVAPIMLVLVAAHAYWLSGQQRYAMVVEMTGKATVATDKTVMPLHVGDQLDALKLPLITTGAKSAVVLAMPGSRLEIEPKSSVAIKRLGFNHGEIRQFDLRHGEIHAALQDEPGQDDCFTIISGGIQARELGVEFSVEAKDGGVQIAALDGPVSFYDGKIKKVLPSDHKIRALGTHSLSAPEKLSAQEKQTAKSVFAAGNKSSWMSQLIAQYRSLQKKAFLPVANKALALAHLREQQKQLEDDAKVLITARVSLDAICKGVLLNGEPLEDLDVATLSELGLAKKDRDRILSSFEKHRLLDYYAHKDHFIVLARAADSNHTLFKAEDGVVVAVKDADEEKEWNKLMHAKETTND